MWGEILHSYIKFQGIKICIFFCFSLVIGCGMPVQAVPSGWSTPIAMPLMHSPVYSIAIDSHGAWHAVNMVSEGTDPTIFKLRYVNSAGFSQELDSWNGPTSMYTPRIVIAQNDSIHVAYTRGTQDDVLYTSNTDNHWSTPIAMPLMHSPVYSIAIDSHGAWHAVNMVSEGTDPTIFRLRYVNSTGFSQELDSWNGPTSMYTPQIVIDQNDGIHVAYTRGTQGDVLYTSNTDNHWSTPIAMPLMHSPVYSIAIDSHGTWHAVNMVSEGTDPTIFKLRYVNSTGFSQELDSWNGPTSMYTPQIVIDQNDGIHVAYSRGTQEDVLFTEKVSVVPVILVHGWMGDPHVWDDLDPFLKSKGIQTFIFDYSDDNTNDPRIIEARFEQWIQDEIRNPAKGNYQGKFDIVCHSMGALVTRWYMEKEGGGSNVRQWIGICPVNNGAAIADFNENFPDLVIQILDIFNPNLADTPAVRQMNTESRTVTDLQTAGRSPGVIYRVITGYNLNEASSYGGILGKTIEMKMVSGERTYGLTYWGDGVVAYRQSNLTGAGMYCFGGYDHNSAPHMGPVLNLVTNFILNPELPLHYDRPSTGYHSEFFDPGRFIINHLFADIVEGGSVGDKFNVEGNDLGQIRIGFRWYFDNTQQNFESGIQDSTPFVNPVSNPEFDFNLTTPSGTQINLQNAINFENIQVITNQSYLGYLISNPEIGAWGYDITPHQLGSEEMISLNISIIGNVSQFSPTVTRITPTKHRHGGKSFSAMVNGSGFQPGITGTRVILWRIAPAKNITASGVNVGSSAGLTCLFKIPKKTKPGAYNVTVINPDGLCGMRIRGFKILT